MTLMSGSLVFYRGPRGSSDHRAVRLFGDLREPDTHPMMSLWQVLETVDNTPDAFGVVPIESSIDGELMSVVDRVLFSTSRLLFASEAVLSETVAVYAHRPDCNPRVVVSHPEILQICHSFIVMNGLQSQAADATSAACERVRNARDSNLVALAPREVAESYGLALVTEDPAGIGEIRTRYLLASQRVAGPSGSDRTMLAITPPRDAPGVLARILEAFSNNAVNISSLTSRPLRVSDARPHYAFVITCDGHVVDDNVRAAVSAVLESGCAVRLLGVYARWLGPEVCTPFGEVPLGSVTAADGGRVLDPPRAVGLGAS
jgi:prephenate dehydratase